MMTDEHLAHVRAALASTKRDGRPLYVTEYAINALVARLTAAEAVCAEIADAYCETEPHDKTTELLAAWRRARGIEP